MAVKKKSTFWQMLHFLTRFLGLLGLVGAISGWFIWGILRQEELGLLVMTVSAGVVGFALLFEVPSFVRLAFSQRGVFGFNVVLQIALALAIVIGANYYSFFNFQRFDLTEQKLFTLDDNIRAQLAQLRGDTDIIIFQNYRSFGHRAKDEADKDAQRAKNQQEKIDFSAQRKIIEKVKDLAEQFGDFGPRFHVHVLDMKDDNFDNKMKEIKAISPDLEGIILSAPENSVFFYSREQKQVQRLSFSEIYQVDTQGSLEQKNLVLRYQGEKPFANKIFNIEQKTPRLAAAVIHPVLGLQNKDQPMLTLNAAKKTLDKYNIAALDVVMRKIGEDGDLSEDPTALTYDESRFEQIEDELAEREDAIKDQQKKLEEFKELYKLWSESSLAKLNTKFIYYYLQDGRGGVALRTQADEIRKSPLFLKFVDVDDEDIKIKSELYDHNSKVVQRVLKRNTEIRDSLVKEKATLKVESLAEKRRVTDIEVKTKAMLANVDLLIVPRVTLLNVVSGQVIPNRLHKLDTAQLNAIRWYLKEGKPALFLLGPANDPREGPDLGGGGNATDSLESMLAELGFKLPKQTILYNVEEREFSERKTGGAFGSLKSEIEVPGLKFDDTATTSFLSKVKEEVAPHPLRTSLSLMHRGGAKTEAGEIRIKHPRPVYYVRTTMEPASAGILVGGLALPGFAGPIHSSTTWLKKAQLKPDENAVFLVSSEESWNEDNPFLTKNKAPAFTPPKDDDPRKGTVEEPRIGPFPIGVAVEAPIPADWYEKDSANPKTARIAVIGSGSAFVGAELTPMKERMLLDVVNWLIGRDDLLAKDAESWEYPRVKLTNIEFDVWQWSARLFLPLTFVFLGVVVTMARNMR